MLQLYLISPFMFVLGNCGPPMLLRNREDNQLSKDFYGSGYEPKMNKMAPPAHPENLNYCFCPNL